MAVPVRAFQHVNTRSRDVEGTKDFYGRHAPAVRVERRLALDHDGLTVELNFAS